MELLYREYDNYLECLLCPHFCKIAEGKTGICRVRKNNGREIELLTYGALSGYAVDPVEKKPLYHFFPGKDILSIGSYGCNLRCDFCQNHNISQAKGPLSDIRTGTKKISDDALKTKNNIGVAFTYNEPVIWFEFMRDVAEMIKNENLYTVMISNGFVNAVPLAEITGFIDAFNIDLKAFNKNFYKKLTGADLEPVKKSLKQIARSGRHIEITTLVVPGQNDDEKDMEMQSKWIADELGKNVPLHLSRYFPMYKRDNPATPQETLKKLFTIASEYLDNVYLGNTLSSYGQNTMCSKCGIVVTRRSGYKTHVLNLDKKGMCTNCGTEVYKYFTFSTMN
jgi:pyruvate formate lyase activating enzyme